MRYTRITFVLALFGMLVACGIDNTMYNANKYFKSAQDRALNANGRPTPQAVDEYTKAIQKCGIILSRNSKGKQADDALFLMARALYYKKNSAFQAKDAFENLIKGYPDSKHIPDAHLYLARVMREVNQASQSEALLEQFVRNPKYLKHHARALLLLADFEIDDEDYIRSQYWLERILTDYRKAEEFKDAFFLFGKNYYMQGDYEKSLEEFTTFTQTRGIPKLRKLEAGYYIALNLFELERYPEALKEVKYVVRNESRPDMLSRAKVLYGRILLANGDEEGLEQFEEVTKSYARTEHSAAAYYFWGRYLYFNRQDWDTSVTHLNKVRTEYSAGEYIEVASQLAAAINQTKRTLVDDNSNLQAFLDYHYQRAESFLKPIALPDSALTSYRRVISERDSIAAEADSLRLMLAEMQVEIDSLSIIVPDSLESLEALPAADSSLVTSEVEAESPDSLAAEIDTPEFTVGEADSLQDYDQNEPAPSDSLLLQPEEVTDRAPEADSLAASAEESSKEEPVDPSQVALQRLTSLRSEIQRIQDRIEPLEIALQRFDSEIIPFCNYSLYSILRDIQGSEEEAEVIRQEMNVRYPRNMYSAAINALAEGRTPSLVDPVWEEADSAFDHALDYYPEYTDSLLTAMLSFTESDFGDIRGRANYRLGWYYSFEEPDTTLAKVYLNVLLEENVPPEYAEAARRFYNGQNFLKRELDYRYYEPEDSLATVIADSLGTDAADIPDTQNETSLPDTLSQVPEIIEDAVESESDSLSLEDNTPAVPDIPDVETDAGVAPDSLSQEIPETVPEELPSPESEADPDSEQEESPSPEDIPVPLPPEEEDSSGP
ncbi:MAG: tetratricopeptide repeat protein [Candidatus Cloacimonetes bacterium]|nr:tetratricopeptide repeat protein [Candidatus Cloacimonadota bacterium]MDD2506065.1 tetratricopeptide repeat protein [Candidatus Cloacimonadota bacterium]MDD4559648.1 tetratricopeptide repeat protein [Candidatus Cloacimonadota bacterium]